MGNITEKCEENKLEIYFGDEENTVKFEKRN